MGLRQLRNIVFWTLVLLYFILAPVICLQAVGFVFDPRTISFVKTGIISVDSEPKEANVYLNDALYAKKTPTAISRLRTGHYQVRVEARDCQTWTRSLDVRAEEVTRAEHILLVPSALKPSRPFSFPIHAILPSRDERFLFLISKMVKSTAVYAFDLRKERLMLLIDHEESLENRTVSIELATSVDDKRLLVAFRGKGSVDYIVATLSERAVPISLSKLLEKPVSNVRFHPRNSKELFYLQNGILSELNLDEGTLKEKILRGVKSFEVIEDQFYYFTEDMHLFSANLEGKEVIDLLPDRGLRRLLFSQGKQNTNQMFFTPKKNAFWLSTDGTLLTNRLPYFVDEDVAGARLLLNSEKLFYWKSNELWLLDLSVLEEKRQKFFEQGPSKTLLWQSEEPITFAQVMRGGNHVMVATEKEIVMVETDPLLFGNHFVIGKYSLQGETTFYLDDESGELYWIDVKDKDRELYRAKLFRPALSPFTFSLRKSYQPPMEISL